MALYSISGWSCVPFQSSSDFVPQQFNYMEIVHNLFNYLQYLFGKTIIQCSVILFYFFHLKILHLLAISNVDCSEKRIVFWGRLSILVFKEEDRGSSNFNTYLLNSLFIVDRQKEGLNALFRFYRHQYWEIFWKISICKENKVYCYKFCNYPMVILFFL